MTTPDFLIIGAQKAGTTSLRAYLSQHRELFFTTQKEPHYFCGPGDGRPPPWTAPGDAEVMQHMTFDPEAYAALYRDSGARRRGEASTMYLVDPAVPERVVAANPAVKVVVLLRDPVTRAHAAWWMWRRARYEPLDFADALAAEPERKAAGWGPKSAYREIGCYGTHLHRWRSVLDPAQMLAVRSEDLRTDRLATVRAVFAFLGVDPDFAPDVSRELNNQGGRRPRAGRGRHPVRSLRVRTRRLVPSREVRDAGPEVLGRRRPPIDAGVQSDLRASYVDEVRRTEAMLGWDLRTWR